jgi:hypothetical protein
MGVVVKVAMVILGEKMKLNILAAKWSVQHY